MAIKMSSNTNNNANITELMNLIREQATTQQAGTREQAKAESEELTLAAIREFEQTVLPEILAAQEGAGASGGALTALIASEQAAAAGGQVAERRLAHVGRADELTARERGEDLQALLGLLGNQTTLDMNRRDNLTKLRLGLQRAGTTTGSTGQLTATKSLLEPMVRGPQNFPISVSDRAKLNTATGKSKTYARGKY